MNVAAQPTGNAAKIPFDAAKLDRLMDEAGLDLLVINSKHNVQYLLGGHRAFFFDYMDAMGVSRYLPLLVYPKGDPAHAGYFGHRMENHQHENKPFWTPMTQANCSATLDTMEKAVDHIRRSGVPAKRIGIEMAFMPLEAATALRAAFPSSEFEEALYVLERMRAVKTPGELALLRAASDKVIESMLAVMASHGPGATKRELAEALRREETNRGLTFEYCLITAGTSLNRAPSEQRWEAGDILSLDSGGNYHGYIGDLCRMAIHGEPDSELVDMLDEIEAIQRAGMKPVRAGVMGGEIYAAAEPLVRKSKHHNHMHFLAHGMGLVSHEAPRLTSNGPVPYSGEYATLPLETGMVVSIETTLQHPRRGFIKLEDTVAVTDNGFEIFGEGGRGWNRGGTAIART